MRVFYRLCWSACGQRKARPWGWDKYVLRLRGWVMLKQSLGRGCDVSAGPARVRRVRDTARAPGAECGMRDGYAGVYFGGAEI